jgi:hypothetical protein
MKFKFPFVRSKLLFTLYLTLISFTIVKAQTETISSGSFIINMGVVPQTVGNALKPYGMIYDLMRNNNVPIKWVIGQTKVKDGADFTYNGTAFKGGTFIIPAEYRSAAVNAKITTWVGLGVVGVTSTTAFSVNVTQTLKSVPRWTLDDQNGAKAEAYLIAAGISNAAFPGAYNWKAPAALDCCDDFFVMPHADPVWATHSRLLTWNKDCLGSIWLGCHAGSALANMVNPADRTKQTNFLAVKDPAFTGVSGNYANSNSLILWGSHSGGSVPYIHRLPSDPISQYMGSTDAAQLNGSEQIYIPRQGSLARWNPGAKIIAYDNTQVNVPVLNPDLSNAAAVIAYGRGFDDPARGYVMYEACHSFAGTAPANVAAQRVFLNFSFFQVQPKAPQLGTVSGVAIGQSISNSTPLNLSISASSPLIGMTFTYQWISACGGVFSAPTGSSTTYTPPTVGGNTPCTITCVVTDNCGRKSFQMVPVLVVSAPLPPVVNADAASISSTCGVGTSVTTNVLANDSDPAGLKLTVTNVTGASNGTMSYSSTGNISFTPDANFTGPMVLTYTVCNNATPVPLCTNGTYTISLSGASTPAVANDTYTISEDAIGNFNVLSNDDPALTIMGITVKPANGRISINANNTITYIPNADFAGTDNLTYQVVNASGGKNTATVTITVSNDACDGGTYTIVPVIAPMLTLSPTADTYIDENVVGTNFGTATTLNLNRNPGKRQRILMNFNVSTIPSTSKIAYARLYLNQSTSKTDVSAVYRANAAWTEAGANWTNMNANFDGVTAYPAGGITPQTGVNIFDITALVQAWVNGTFTNQGLMLKVITESGGAAIHNYSSKEDVANRPYLEIVYSTNASSLGTANLTAITDTYIDQDPANINTNFGGVNPLHTDRQALKANRALLKFDLSAIPANTSVYEGIVNVNQTSSKTDIIAAYRIQNSWVENTATWTSDNANFDAATAFPTGGITPVSGWNQWNIGNLVNQWQNNTYPNNGVMLKVITESGTASVSNWVSREESGTPANRPFLTANYFTGSCSAIPTRAPVSMPDTATAVNGVTLNIATATNDYFPVAGAVTYSIITPPASGLYSINGTGVVNYTPNTTFNGVRTLVYEVTHTASGLKDTGIVYINITNGPLNAVDDAPAGSLSGVVQTITVKTNDTDPEVAGVPPATYTVGIVTGPANGTATVNGSGQIVYTPNANFTGNDTLYYSLCEPAPACGSAFCDTARVVVIVQNRPPVAVADSKTVLPCKTSSFNLTSNDTDPENGILTVNIVSGPASGTLVNNNDGTVTYTPAPGFTGLVTFTYSVTDDGVTPQTSLPVTVSITVNNPVNTAPVAVNDVETMNMDEVLYSSILDNDYDPESQPLSLPVIITAPVHGTAIVLANGLVQYTPNPGFFGTDVLTYRICDSTIVPASCTFSQGLCSTATLTITIPAPNTVVAVNDENSTWINTPVSGDVMGNDYDPEGDTKIFTGFVDGGTTVTSGSITVSGVDATGAPVANAGTLTINTDGTYTFTPANNFTGVVTVPYTIADNKDNAAVDTALLRITVNPYTALTNSIIANNDENISYGAAVGGNVISNDRDPQGNTFSVTGFKFDTDGDGTADGTGTVGTPVAIGGKTTSGLPVSNAGTLTLNADGSYTFTPATDFHGSIDVPYTICDNGVPVACQTAILHIDVLTDLNGPANDPPVAGDDFNYTNINTPVNGSFINNDSDPNGNPVSLNGTTINTAGPATPIGAPVATAKGGTIQYYANGTYKYTPPVNYVGPDSVAYTICDVTVVAPQPLCTKAFIHLLVGVNNTTDAINDENSTWQDVNVSGNVLTNDFDKENNAQTFGSFLAQGGAPGAPIASGAILSGVDKTGAPVLNAGVITFAADGSYTFDPSPSFTGTVTVPYTVCDNGNLSKCDTAFLTITIDPLPTSGTNTIIANNDENISYGNPVTNTLFANDRDPQNDAFTVTSIGGGTVGTPFSVSGIDQNGNVVANAGTLVINANGTYTFTPAPGFVGSIDVPYTVTDALGATSTAKLHIDVIRDPNGPANDPPFAGDDFSYTTINKAVAGNFISNDTDQNANPLSLGGVTIVPGGPATPIGAPVPTLMGGTVQFYADGTYLYTPPVGYVGPDNVNYTTCDVTAVAPQPLCTDAQIHLLIGPGVSISGKVWDDANGNVIDPGATEPETNIGGTLYVNLVDGLGNVVATTAVAANGTYNFSNITPGVNYSVQLSTNQGTVGNPAPVVALPAGWANTGETRNGTIDGGTIGVIDTRNFGYTNTINFDFGIEQLPETENHSTVITIPTIGQVITLNGGGNPPVLSGSDPEDQAANGVLTSKTVKITTIPSNSELYYNGSLVIAGQTIPNFDPNLLAIKITAASVGTNSTSFTYAFVDAAGKVDPTPATYTLNWAGLLPIDIVSFTANKVNNTSVLNFVIAQPVQGSVFTVERSTTGTGFTAIGSINSTNATSYNYTDLNPVPNMKNYYRIREVDLRGMVSYSVIRMVKFTGEIKIDIYPVPAVTSINISLNDVMLNKPITISLFNSNGQELMHRFVNKAATTEVLDIRNIANGIYQLRITNNNEVIADRKLVIIK